MASDRNVPDRLWITPATAEMLTDTQRGGLSLLLRAYHEEISLRDAANPFTPELARARRLFQRRPTA